MTLLNRMKIYLADKPWLKAKIIAHNLGESRRAVTSVLRANSETFKESQDHTWSIIDIAGAILDGRDIPKSSVPDFPPDSQVFVENIDLVERVKEILKAYGFLKIRDIAERLNVSRSLTNRTLHSFQNVFEKTEDNQWFIRSDYLDNTDGPDADFISIGRVAGDLQLPIVDFKEAGKPPQQAVIEAKLDRNFLVLAPPGTGKTHTLIERLVYAVTKSSRELWAGELLVLSFTRAAVGEIRERITKAIANGAPSALRYVQVKTFDAYATWLLNDGGYDLTDKTYDERIKLLTKELKAVNLRQLTDRVGRSRYLFVDEIQDLVGLRADMVFELVKRTLTVKGSVTLLGDPHQSLNDYQIKEHQTDSAEFLIKVQSHLSGGLEQFELEESHRYETPEMKVLAASAKLILDDQGVLAKDKFLALVDLIPKISQEELIEKFNSESVDALLCRSNGEVYQWLNWHQEQGNDCTVNAGAIGRPWQAWIGEAVMHYQREVITYQDLVSRIHSNVSANTTPSKRELDNFLNNERLLRHKAINLDELAFRLKYLSPAIKGDLSEKGLIVSTVHKAKGLEYKNIVAIQPSQKNITDEEVRVLYVAITRAKRSIFLLPKKEAPFSGWMKKRKGGHLGYAENGIKFLQVTGLEDFDLETLFINADGGIDIDSFENFQLCYRDPQNYCIRPESLNAENDHNYAFYLNSILGPIRLCAVSRNMKKSLDAMAWGNGYGEDGTMLNCGNSSQYQTIVHPMQSPILSRLIGPSGIMVFPLIQGFYPLSKSSGE